MTHKNFRLILLTFFLLGLFLTARAQESASPLAVTKDGLAGDKQIALDKLSWKYHAGDDLDWANPNFDDSAWETLNGTILTLDNLPKSGWNGIGWFRLRLKVDNELMNQQLALIMDHWGASEIYVDGELVNRFGKVGATAETEEAYRPNNLPFVFEFHGGRAEHLIAVRHSMTALREPSSLWSRFLSEMAGFNFFSKNVAGAEINVARAENAFQDYEYAQKVLIGNRFWRAGMQLMIGLVFLMLYLFYPSRRGNLYFSIFAIFLFLNLIWGHLTDSTHYDLPVVAFSAMCSDTAWAVALSFLLIFLYTDFAAGRIPKYFRFFVVVFAGYLLAEIFFATSKAVSLMDITLMSFVLVESIRLMSKAITRRQNGAWIVGIGIAMFGMAFIQGILSDFYNLFNASTPFPYWFIFLSRQFPIGLTVLIAIYLARQFAQTNKNLEAQLIKEVEQERATAVLRAENERRAKELEEARQLQLSMLPKKLPNIAGLEIAAYMKPATEVGGDYYDFHVGKDGTLTVAVGDATGHGLKAGSVVTATKSLFNAFAKQNDIPQILKEISQALKQMNLRGLFMAMTMLKIKDGAMNICVAGMPSVLIYKSLTGKVEEVAIRAMPLGSITKTDYQEKEFTLEVGDVVLIMSDGFPEMFNAENEMLGFGKAAEVLPIIAMNSAQEIINHLVKVGDEWANGRAADDDVTFVVLKVSNGREL